MVAHDVTVIIPTFNAEATIERALSSVARQLLQPSRVVVVDDCSSDATARRVLECATGSLVDLVRLESNSGPASARQEGLERVTSEFDRLTSSPH